MSSSTRAWRPSFPRFVVSGWMLILCAACGAGPDHEEASHSEHGGVLALAREGEEAGASGGVSSRSFIGPLESVPAQVATGVASFSVLSRTPGLTKTPCARCHTVSLAEMKGVATGETQRAHWAIELAHADTSVMRCATCHDSKNTDLLRSLEGRPVTFDHAYLVCAQCHDRQRDDWEGGAHGKRVGGWAPPRVVYNCTECHDPHRPVLELRWPAHAGRARE